jgi:hypothetical protein
MRNDATCGDFERGGKEMTIAVQEVDVERKSHAKGMHARTARNEETWTSLVALETSEAEQTTANTRCHPDAMAVGRDQRKRV